MEFKLEIKNLVLSDSIGCDLMKEVVVRATSSASKQVCHLFCFLPECFGKKRTQTINFLLGLDVVKEQICEQEISDARTLSTAPAPEEHRQCNENEVTGLWVWFRMKDPGSGTVLDWRVGSCYGRVMMFVSNDVKRTT